MHSTQSIINSMTTRMEKIEDKGWYDKAYLVTVAIKGFDGLVELIAGVWLLIAPASLHAVLGVLFGEAAEHNGRFMHFVAENIAHIDTSLTAGGILVVSLFLLTHGVVKLAMVYALLREILWAYPYALAVLTAFLVYQVYVFITHPGVGMALFSLLDAVIIFMVYGEWQKLKRKVTRSES